MNPPEPTHLPPIGNPTHPEEVAEYHNRMLAQNAERARVKLAETNRAKGIPAPSVGEKMYVSAIRGMPRRGRAGLRFDQSRREVEIVDLDAPALLKAQADGKSVVSLHGAEEILADDSLITNATAQLASENAANKERVTELEAENASLRQAVAAARRQAPPDPGDGTSSRLKAADKAREDFGGAPPTSRSGK